MSHDAISREDVFASSGNVFADLEVDEPDAALVHAALARSISAIVETRRLSQVQVAELLGIDQPKVSALLRGRLAGFSTDRLLRFLLALDRDVEILIKPTGGPHVRGRVHVTAVA